MLVKKYAMFFFLLFFFFFFFFLIYLEYYVRSSNFINGTNFEHISLLKIKKLIIQYLFCWINCWYTRKYRSTHNAGLSLHFSQKYLDSFRTLFFVHIRMVLLDLFFSLFVVIWKGHENQRELDVPDRKVCGPASAAAHCMKSAQIRSYFWFVFSHIWTEYGEIRSVSPYSIRMRENMDQKKLRISTLFT